MKLLHRMGPRLIAWFIKGLVFFFPDRGRNNTLKQQIIFFIHYVNSDRLYMILTKIIDCISFNILFCRINCISFGPFCLGVIGEVNRYLLWWLNAGFYNRVLMFDVGVLKSNSAQKHPGNHAIIHRHLYACSLNTCLLRYLIFVFTLKKSGVKISRIINQFKTQLCYGNSNALSFYLLGILWITLQNSEIWYFFFFKTALLVTVFFSIFLFSIFYFVRGF